MRKLTLCLLYLFLSAPLILLAQRDSSRVVPFLGAGLHRSNIAFGEQTGPMNSYGMMDAMEYEPYIGYIIKTGMDYHLGQKLQDIFLRLELSYHQTVHKGKGEWVTSYWGTREQLSYELRMKTVGAHLYGNYDLARVGRGGKFSAGIGGGANKSVLGRNRINTFSNGTNGMSYGEANFSDHDPIWWDVSARVGLRYRHLEANLSSTLFDSFTTFRDTKADESILSFTLHYRF